MVLDSVLHTAHVVDNEEVDDGVVAMDVSKDFCRGSGRVQDDLVANADTPLGWVVRCEQGLDVYKLYHG